VKVVLLAGADDDLKALRLYITKNFGKDAWLDTSAKLKKSFEVIKTLPAGGSVPDELVRLGLKEYRQVVSGMNRIVYEVSGQVALVHIICDTRRDMRGLLSRRLLWSDYR
jgi:toxin ParE1/3/4